MLMLARFAIGSEEAEFRRAGGGGDKVTVPVVNEPIETEFGGSFHHRPRAISQEFFVPAERIMLPEIPAQPGATHGPICPYRITAAVVAHRPGLAPDIGIVVRHPAVGAVVDLGGLASVNGKHFDEIQKRLVALGEIGNFGRPVIHLGVNVQGPVGTPGRARGIIPNALQVGGQSGGPGAGNQKVTPILVKQRGQAGIGFALCEAGQTFVRGQTAGAGSFAEIDLNAAE